MSGLWEWRGNGKLDGGLLASSSFTRQLPPSHPGFDGCFGRGLDGGSVRLSRTNNGRTTQLSNLEFDSSMVVLTMDACHDLFRACKPFHWNIRVHGPPDATIRCVHRGLLSDFPIPSRGRGSPVLKNSDKAAQASQPTAPSLAFPALPACNFSNPSYRETKVSWFRWQALCKLSAAVSWITVSFNLDSSLPVPVPLRLDL